MTPQEMSDQQLVSEGRRLGILGGPPQPGGGGDFASRFRAHAQAASDRIFQRTGQRVDPNAILAQAALETGWGKSAPGNNFFGIKGAGQSHATNEFMDGQMQRVTDSFRAYESPEQSFLDYADLISGGRYLPGLAGTARDPASHGANMAALGYATDPEYGQKFRSVYERIAGQSSQEEPGMLARAADAVLNFVVPPAAAESMQTPPGEAADRQRLQDSIAAPGTVGTEGGVQLAPVQMSDAQLLEAAQRLGIGPPGTTPTTATGAPFLDRLRASFKTPTGLLNFIQEEYGKGNVAVRPDGRVFYRDDPNGQWKSWDESGISLADVADFAGDVPATGGAILGAGVTGGSPLGAGAGAAIGDIIKQFFASKLVPGDDAMTIPERAAEVTGNFVAGAGSQWLGNKAVNMFDRLRPSNLAANQVRESLKTPFAQEGAKLSKDTGVPLTLGQETGNKLQLGIEGLARRNVVSADDFAKFDDAQKAAAVEKIDDIMQATYPKKMGDVAFGSSARAAMESGLTAETTATAAKQKAAMDAAVGRLNQMAARAHGNQVSSADLGATIAGAFDDAVSKAVDFRRAQAANDFGIIDSATGKRPLIRTDNFRQTLEEIVRDHSGPGMPTMSQRVASEAQAILDGIDLVKEGVKNSPTKYRATAQRVQKWLERWGNAAAGSGKAFSDLDTAADRRLAGIIRDAILKDIDDTAAEAGMRGNIAQALQRARANYAQASEMITGLRESFIGRQFGGLEKAPERIAETFLRMRPTEIQQTVAMLQKNAPELLGKAQRRVLDAAVEKAYASGDFSIDAFMKALPQGDTLGALFPAGPMRQEFASTVQVMRGLQRMAQAGAAPTDLQSVAKLLGGAERSPEKIANTVYAMAQKEPTVLSQVMSVLGKRDPDLLAKTRRFVLERALESARPAASRQAIGGVPFSPAQFVSALPEGDAFEAVFGSSLSRNDLVQLQNVLRRIAGPTGAEGSPTAPLLMAWDLAKGVFTLNPRAIAGIPTAVLAPKAIARAALTPQGRQALVTLTKTGVPQRQVVVAAEMLIALSAAEEDATPEMAKAAGGQALP